MQRVALRQFSHVIAPVLSGVVYFVMAAIALATSRFGGGLAFIWIANAWLMAQLLTTGPHRWLRIILPCAIASMIGTALFGMGATAALPMAVINISEALLVAILCRRFVPEWRVAESMRPLAIFILALCGCANVLAGAAAALVAFHLKGVAFGDSWLQWYTGHVLGGLTCTPILIMLFQGEFGRWKRATATPARFEALALLLLFAGVTWWIFYRAHYPMLFASLLPLVLIAFRVGHLGTAAAIVLLAIIGGTATVTGYGPLNMLNGTLAERIQLFQFYLAFSFLLAMPIAAELNGRRRLFQMLQESEARFRLMAEHNGDVVLNLSIDGIIHYASPSAIEQMGYTPQMLEGRKADDLVDPRDRPVVIATHQRALADTSGVHTVEFRPLLAADGVEWCEMVSRAVLNDRGIAVGVVSTVRDMSRHKARQHALQRVVAVDSLTGADSRRAFLEKLEDQIDGVGQGARACLLLIDIDHFKAINDRYGHGVGDQVLRHFVDRLRIGLRDRDSIGRLGGEEFAILLADADIGRASGLCERLRGLVSADPIRLASGEAIAVTFSAGLVELNGRADGAALLEAADKALYRAKHSGRNCLRLAA